MHQAGIIAGRERMRSRNRDGGFGRHARVTDRVRSDPARELQPVYDLTWIPNTLEYFNGFPLTENCCSRDLVDQPFAGGTPVARRLQNDMILNRLRAYTAAKGLRQLRGEAGAAILHGFAKDDADFGNAAGFLSVDGETRAIRSSIAQLHEHRGRQSPELGFEPGIFQEQADDAAHA